MDSKTVISKFLKNRGYKNVLETDETDPEGVIRLVKCGEPLSWDHKNDVTVVYDEKGEPWIKQGQLFLEDFKTVMLSRGAHVPHSNDGGYFVSEVLPTM